MNKETMNKIVEAFYTMLIKSEEDELIYGDSFWEITDKKIELIDPRNTELIKQLWISKGEK